LKRRKNYKLNNGRETKIKKKNGFKNILSKEENKLLKTTLKTQETKFNVILKHLRIEARFETMQIMVTKLTSQLFTKH